MTNIPIPQGFIRLSGQQSHDAALLRASTELFVQAIAHDRDEIRRYEDLAFYLVPRVKQEDRIFVAGKLAVRIDAPVSVVRLLARDVIEVAEPILRHSPVLGSLDLLSAIAATEPAHHRLIAGRTGLSEEVERALRLGSDPEVAEILDRRRVPGAGPTHSGLDAGPAAADRHDSARHGRDDQSRLDPWVFLSLDRKARLRLMAKIATAGYGVAQSEGGGAARQANRAFRSILSAAQIVGLARIRDRQSLIDSIADGLDLTPEFVVACVDDTTGEPLAALLKALSLTNEQAQQVMLLASPVGREPGAFFSLCDLYAGMEPTVAETLTESWRDKPAAAPARHSPVFADTRDRARTDAEAARPKPSQIPGRTADGRA